MLVEFMGPDNREVAIDPLDICEVKRTEQGAYLIHERGHVNHTTHVQDKYPEVFRRWHEAKQAALDELVIRAMTGLQIDTLVGRMAKRAWDQHIKPWLHNEFEKLLDDAAEVAEEPKADPKKPAKGTGKKT